MKFTTFTYGMVLVASLAASGCSRSSDPEKYLTSANRYYDARDLEKAKVEYLNALKLQPTNATAILRLGKIFFRQGQLQEAFPLLLESRKRSPNDLEAAEQLAAIFLTARDFAKARTEALAVLELSPTNEAALTILTDAAQDPPEIQEALQKLDQYELKAGDRAVFHVARSQLARRRGDSQMAETELQKALALDPKSVLANMTLGSLRWSQGATNQAEQAFRTASQLAPADATARFRLAGFLLRTGRIEEAKKTLDEINRDAPERTAAWTLRAEVALGEKQLDECARLLDRALGQAPSDFEARKLKAQLRLAQNKPADAVQILEALAGSQPRSGDLQYQLGIAQLLNKELTKAVASFTKATALDPNNISAVLILAELNLARGQAASALDLLTGLVRRVPDLERAHLLLGRAHVAAGRPEDALAVYRAMRPRFPQNPTIPFQMGLLLRQRQQDTEARKAFEEALQLKPDAIEPLEQLVGMDLAAKAPAKALALLQPQLDRQPESARLWLLRARIFGVEKNKEGAETALEKAIELQPEFQAAYLMLAELYLKTGEPGESLKRLDDLLKKNPSNLTALTLSGIIHAQNDRIDEAQRAYEAALKVNPNFTLALNNLAYLLAERRNQVEEAHAYAIKAHQLAEAEPSFADTLGWIEYRRRNYPEALRLLTKAQEDLPGQPEIAYHVGMTHYMMGDEGSAREGLTTALKSSSKFPGRDVAEQRLAILNLNPGESNEKVIESLEKLRKEDPNDLIAALRLSIAYEAAKDIDRARSGYDAVLKLNPNIPDVVVRLAALEVDRNPVRAMELARQGQKLAPNDPRVSWILGRLAYNAGDAPAAYGLLQSAARQMTNQSEVWLDLADAAFGTGRLNEAAEDLRVAGKLGLPPSRTNSAATFLSLLILAQDPAIAAQNQPRIAQILKSDATNGPALYASALGHEQQSKFAEARDAHEKLLQRHPAFTPSIRQLAILYGERLTNDAKAYDLATKARTALPKDDVLAKTLGKLAYRRGDYRYALQLFSEVAKNQPKDADLQFQLGLTHLRLKQLPECRTALERALALDPKGAFVPEARKLLAENKAG